MTNSTKEALEDLGPNFSFLVDHLREIEQNTLVVEYVADMEGFPTNQPVWNQASFDLPVAFVLEKSEEFKKMPLTSQEEVISIILTYVLNSYEPEHYVKMTKIFDLAREYFNIRRAIRTA